MIPWWQRSWAIAVSGAFVATVTVLGLARCKTVERDAWLRVRERAKAMAAPFARGVEAHAPLLGAAQPGFADQHYLAATTGFGPELQGDESSFLHEVLAMDELPPETDARLARHAAALAELAAGAAADQVDYRTFRILSNAGDLAWRPVGMGPLGTAGLLAARRELTAGRHAGAVQRAADVLTLARDQLGSRVALYELLGVSHASATCDFWNDGRLRALPAVEQRRLGEALLRFDVTCSPATSCAAVEAIVIAELCEGSHDDPAQMDAFLAAVTALPPDVAAWSVRRPALTAAAACLPEPRHLRLHEIESCRRHAIARVRLLRMALAHHLGEPVPVLLDPFGEAPLQTSEHEGGLRFASCGSDTDGKPIERIVRAR